MSNPENTTARFSFLRYANCWEDSQILSEALNVKPGEVGLSIASGGDNTFALLLDDPSKIVAFDLNPVQLYCCELKMAAIRNLELADTKKLLGVTPCAAEARMRLFNAIKDDLSSEALQYFEENDALLQNGIIHQGKFEHYFQLFSRCVIPLFATRQRIDTFLRMDLPVAQEEYYRAVLCNRRLEMIFRTFFGASSMGKFGRDKSFYRYVDDKEDSGQLVRARFEAGVSSVPNRTNPYLSYVFTNNFRPEALPEYLKGKNYEVIRSRLDRIELVQGDVSTIEGSFDFFNLSDIFEYMSDTQFEENVDKLDVLTRPGARLAFWNMQVPRFIQHEHFAYEEELSAELAKRDRAYFYQRFYVFRKLGECR